MNIPARPPEPQFQSRPRRNPILSGLFMFVCLSLCGLGAVLLANRDAFAAGKATVTAPAVMAVSTSVPPTETVTPSPMPTPTDDPQIVLAMTRQVIAQKDATIAQQAAQATSAALDNLQRENEQKALYVWTPTAAAVATQNADATNQAYAQRQAVLFQQNQEAVKIEQEKARKQAELENYFAWLWRWFGFVAVCVGVLAVLYFIVTIPRKWQSPQPAASVETKSGEPEAPSLLDNIAHPADAPDFIPVDNATFRRDNPPASVHSFAIWASRMLEGETAGINKWEDGNPFTRASYAPLREWAEQTGLIAETGDGKILSDTGRAFCAAWLARHPGSVHSV